MKTKHTPNAITPPAVGKKMSSLSPSKEMPKKGTRCPKEWGKHLLHYYDGRFINDQMFSLFVFNTIEHHENNSAGSYFFTSGKYLGQNPPTIKELQDRLAAGDDRYIQVLRYYSRNIKGSENYWRPKTQKLESWIQHHVS